ncbi:MAG: YraN family protein [Anaerolineae bacterium]|nr:YraN family protein [Anaerolineae bacterium]
MMSRRRVRLGRQGEDLAVRELVRRGYQLVERNWRCQTGEVDIVARRGDALVFYEVRTRRGTECGTPEESVTFVKKQRMIDVALAYLGAHDIDDVDWSVGLVAIEMDRAGHTSRLEVYETLN